MKKYSEMTYEDKNELDMAITAINLLSGGKSKADIVNSYKSATEQLGFDITIKEIGCAIQDLKVDSPFYYPSSIFVNYEE